VRSLFLSSYFTDVAGLFDRYIEGNGSPRVATFVPTAANLDPSPFYVRSDQEALEGLGFRVEIMDLSSLGPGEIRAQIAKNDFLFVSGGNTFYLLQEMRKKGADAAILDFVEGGKTYIGSSAGSAVLSPDLGYLERMDDRAEAPELSDCRGLGLLDFLLLPHYTCEPFAQVVEQIIRDYGGKARLRPITNAQAIVHSGDGFALLE
jgi:dipeptidase E